MNRTFIQSAALLVFLFVGTISAKPTTWSTTNIALGTSTVAVLGTTALLYTNYQAECATQKSIPSMQGFIDLVKSLLKYKNGLSRSCDPLTKNFMERYPTTTSLVLAAETAVLASLAVIVYDKFRAQEDNTEIKGQEAPIDLATAILTNNSDALRTLAQQQEAKVAELNQAAIQRRDAAAEQRRIADEAEQRNREAAEQQRAQDEAARVQREAAEQLRLAEQRRADAEAAEQIRRADAATQRARNAVVPAAGGGAIAQANPQIDALALVGPHFPIVLRPTTEMLAAGKVLTREETYALLAQLDRDHQDAQRTGWHYALPNLILNEDGTAAQMPTETSDRDADAQDALHEVHGYVATATDFGVHAANAALTVAAPSWFAEGAKFVASRFIDPDQLKLWLSRLALSANNRIVHAVRDRFFPEQGDMTTAQATVITNNGETTHDGHTVAQPLPGHTDSQMLVLDDEDNA